MLHEFIGTEIIFNPVTMRNEIFYIVYWFELYCWIPYIDKIIIVIKPGIIIRGFLKLYFIQWIKSLDMSLSFALLVLSLIEWDFLFVICVVEKGCGLPGFRFELNDVDGVLSGYFSQKVCNSNWEQIRDVKYTGNIQKLKTRVIYLSTLCQFH